MGKGKAKPELGDARGGGYFLLPRCVLDSAAWQAASGRAVKLLLAICARHKGYNNGKLKLSLREAGTATGTQNYAAIGAAFRELEMLGLVALTRDYPRGHRLAREYRLTFVATGDTAATNEYLAWSPGDAGTRKKRVAAIASAASLSAAAVATEAKVSAVAVATETAENAILANVVAEDIATLITNHSPVLSRSRSNHPRIAAGPKGGSAAPSEDELRERVTASLERYGRGTQSRLAELADIPPGTFSRFVNRDGPLNASARIRLTCAMPRLEMRERLSESAAQ